MERETPRAVRRGEPIISGERRGARIVAEPATAGTEASADTRTRRPHDGTYSSTPRATKLGDAEVAVEDEHFYSNFLINFIDGAGRAALATLDSSPDPGGSTIAQQLAKQLYGHGTGLEATLREIGLGLKISLRYSHAQILTMYLNAIYYGHGYWGDAAAARGYFGTTPAALDWAEAAMLAGLPNHYITQAQAAAAFRERLPLGALRHCTRSCL